jgi:hypothetical protein
VELEFIEGTNETKTEEGRNNKRLILIITYIPGHSRLEHCDLSYLSPGQSEPPCAGIGLLHDLDRIHVPLPHVLEHEPHAPHSPQFPSTSANKRCV